MPSLIAPPFPTDRIAQWQEQQRFAELAIRTAPWDQVLPALLQQTAAYSTRKVRAERLWEGQALILHGPTADPLQVEQFGLAVKLGRFISSQPDYTARIQAALPRYRRTTLARRVLADAARLRQWMASHRPAEPLWAPCCGNQGEHLARLLGLQLVTVEGSAWACWSN